MIADALQLAPPPRPAASNGGVDPPRGAALAPDRDPKPDHDRERDHDRDRECGRNLDLDHKALASSYKEADRGFRVQQAKVGCVLVLACMPLGFLLDWFVYPKLLWPFLGSRLLCDLAVVPLFVALFRQWGSRNIGVLGFLWPILPGIAISWMIFASEGAASPYYAGLNLVLIVACLMMPYTFKEALGVCMATLGCYLLACAGHFLRTPDAKLPIGVLFSNVYFISLTTLICVTASAYSTRRRMEDFRLRHELKVRNDQIDESYRKLSQLDRLKSEFFANVSHELRTPLTLIISPIDDLLRNASQIPPETRECLETARRNALRLLKLISDLLEVVRLEEGRAELRKENVDLCVFVPAMVESVGQLARMKGLTLHNQGELKALVVRGDPARLEKVVLNILTNAIKFTPSGGSITSKWWREKDTAIVEITDTGVGIPAEALPRLFERFHQVDGSSTRKYQGIGIGLALARDLVDAHEGKLSARSEVGKGTTLRIELPASDEQAIAAATTAPTAKPDLADPIANIYHAANRTVAMTDSGAAPAATVAHSMGAGKHTVLVVDDEPDLRSFISSTLSKSHRILQAGDGPTGLAMAREKRPDLMVLDLMLPGMDGLDVCRALKRDQNTRSIKIVLLTARMDEHSKITALERGADDFLTKPFSSTELRTRITNLLENADLESQLRNRNQELETTLHRLKETEVQLVQSEKMNALGKLSAGLLHEINNPLNFTTMALDLAEQQASDNAALLETLKDISQGMGRIRTVVCDLRGFAHPPTESGAEPFEINAALTTALRMASQELKDIEIDTTGVNGTKVVGDQNQIVHVLINLLVNSAHALRPAPAGRKPAISVASERRGDRAAVLVRDNGTGVKPEDLPRLCEPFFTTKQVGQGTGLGLSICHTIVKNHGGNLEITSQHGEWTQVKFDLPVARQEP
jgi:signal transduction histidine kinase